MTREFLLDFVKETLLLRVLILVRWLRVHYLDSRFGRHWNRLIVVVIVGLVVATRELLLDFVKEALLLRNLLLMRWLRVHWLLHVRLF
ncbi:hypothetical protein KSS87_019201 [Heliosperma pusillum]|nr:hypothetical protein KSS87_019201 [Heliosperma pusillum]